MPWLERLLLATDFGKVAANARNDVVRIARAYDASVDIVYVDPLRPDRILPRLVLERIEAKLASERTTLENAGVRTRELHIGRGSAAEVVLHVADGLRADLIVIGAGDRSMHEMTTGATAETVARFASQPVWISRKPVIAPLRRVSAGIEVSDASAAALELAADLAKHFDAELQITNVFEPGEGMAEADARQHAELEQFLAERGSLPGLHFQLERVQGRPNDELSKAASRFEADVLVLGRSSGALRRVYLGATAERLLRSAPCSVLLTSPASRS